MALNQCSFIGNLGADPEVRNTQAGKKCANLRIAVTEKWKDQSGERKERTEWVPVVIWGALADVAERYLRKGSKVFVSGKFTTRKWTDQSGNDRYSTEIVLQGFDAKLEMLDAPRGDSRSDDGGYGGSAYGSGADQSKKRQDHSPDFDDEIPF